MRGIHIAQLQAFISFGRLLFILLNCLFDHSIVPALSVFPITQFLRFLNWTVHFIPSKVMAENKSTAQRRLGQVKDFLTMNMTATTIPFDPNCSKFPQRKDVPQAPYAPPGVPTAWVWGEADFIGHLNLLTPTRVKAAATSEIKTGEMVSLK